MSGNFFKKSDPTVKVVGGMELLPSWWSRAYEYAWAKQFLGKDLDVVDMGAGWSGRPFKEEMAEGCRSVVAVDLDPRFLELPNKHPNMRFVVANFEQEIKELAAESFDRVFCISVLEDLTNYDAALREFARLLKPGGLLVITCDSQYDENKPLPKYPGVSFDRLFNAIQDAGLSIIGNLNMDREDAVVNLEWNLACYHVLAEKDDE